MDLSKMSVEELDRLREEILKRARKTVDPEGTGFDPLMMSTDDSGVFSTDDVTFADWLDWVQQGMRTIVDASVNVGISVIAAGGAIAASQMFATERGWAYAGTTLAVSGAFAAWFVVGSLASRLRGR
jgi:hypothetical protein